MDRQILESMVCDAVERGIITAKMVVGMYPPTVAVGILDGRGREIDFGHGESRLTVILPDIGDGAHRATGRQHAIRSNDRAGGDGGPGCRCHEPRLRRRRPPARRAHDRQHSPESRQARFRHAPVGSAIAHPHTYAVAYPHTCAPPQIRTGIPTHVYINARPHPRPSGSHPGGRPVFQRFSLSGV